MLIQQGEGDSEIFVGLGLEPQLGNAKFLLHMLLFSFSFASYDSES
jgi:hypothetical protein